MVSKITGLEEGAMESSHSQPVGQKSRLTTWAYVWSLTSKRRSLESPMLAGWSEALATAWPCDPHVTWGVKMAGVEVSLVGLNPSATGSVAIAG